jgi:hypothetical protein
MKLLLVLSFLGAFWRPQGQPPYGVFANATTNAPVPYTAPSKTLFGPAGYCDAVAANGYSITSGAPIDQDKLANLVDLGVGWVRFGPSTEQIDGTHIFSPPSYAWETADAAQCETARFGITSVVELDAGPVEYDATPMTFSPTLVTTYKTPADFGTWCSAVATHEAQTFGSTRFSLPGNEVNTNASLFPGGTAQIAAYSEACYKAVKAAIPTAFVYGFELNMDGSKNAPGFVASMLALGCGPGTCYDGLAIHLTLQYPMPSAGAPCYPAKGGVYGVSCLKALQTAAGASVHFIISETVYAVPSSVPDAATQALAVVAGMNAYKPYSSVDGVSYANIDECALYVGTIFAGGCIVDTNQNRLPAYGALEAWATP